MMRFIGYVMTIWVFVILYMGFNVYQLVDESKKSSQELHTFTVEVDQLKRENEKLRLENVRKNSRYLEEEARRTNKLLNIEERHKKEMLQKIEAASKRIRSLEIQLKEARTTDAGKHSLKYETLSRRVANQIKEMWFLVSSHVKLLKRLVPEIGYEDFMKFLESFRDMNQITEKDFSELISLDGAQEFKDNLANKLSEEVQNRLRRLQNPADCSNAKKLVCSLNKGCGYGCQMHHVLYCFIVAYSTGRTLIVNSSGWRYSSKGWNTYFESISDTCKTYSNAQEWSRGHEQHKVVHLPIVDAMFPRPQQMPLSVPRDLYKDMRMFSGHPFVWWIGQFAKYLFRYKPNLRSEIDEKKRQLGFKSPIVGVQIRRTDKINLEAAYHSIEEYMHYVDLYYKKLELNGTVDAKRVFLATDDATVLPEARKKYPDYMFLSDADVASSAKLSSRYSEESLHGVISDIELLSDTDFLVCTFSSQVCRLAYEIMNSKHTDASQWYRSLDDIYYFGGQKEHRMKVIWPHEAKGRSELDLKIGDIIGIAGNHWNGQAKGLHHGYQKTGLFPAFKIEDVHDVEDFPIPGG